MKSGRSNTKSRKNARPGAGRSKRGRDVSSLSSALAPLVGKVKSSPDDASINLDYYLHGTRKQRPRRGRWLKGSRKKEKPFTAAGAKQFSDKLDALAADIGELPSDLAINHDHYIHGLAKP